MKTKTFACVLLSMALLWISAVFAQDTGNSPITPESVLPRDGIPPYEFVPFMRMFAFDHPGFGTYLAALGDVNQDGYDDFAVSTMLDTTFIFFGGPFLDDRPDAFVLGGGYGLVAGDVNGDGRTDIYTSQRDYDHVLDPDHKGLVRLYLHNGTPSMYNSTPDLVFIGRNKNSSQSTIVGLDINGDKKLDLLLSTAKR